MIKIAPLAKPVNSSYGSDMYLSPVQFVAQALLPQELVERTIYCISKPPYQPFVRALCDGNDTSFDEMGLEGNPSIKCDPMKWPNDIEHCADVVIACETLQYAEDAHGFLGRLCGMAKETLILTTRSRRCPSGGEGDAWRFDIDDLIRGVAAFGMIATISQHDEEPGVPGVLFKAVRPGFVSIIRTPRRSVAASETHQG